MAFTFNKAQGKEIGGSLVEEDRVEMARALLAKAGGKIVLPVDTVVTDAFDFDARKVGTLKTVAWDAIGPKDIGVDIGEATRAKFAASSRARRRSSGTARWASSRSRRSAKGTLAVAQALADATAHGAITVVGGGDTVAAVEKIGLADKVTHVSTGGGASLEFLEGKVLPGVAFLEQKTASRWRTASVTASPARRSTDHHDPTQADRRQLEDEQDRLRGGGPRRGDQEGAAGAPSDILVAPPYTSLVAAVARGRRAARSRSPRRTCTSRRTAPSPARSPRRC